MNRRHFQIQIAAILAAAIGRTGHAAALPDRQPDAWEAIEAASGGRLGVAVLRDGGRLDGHRLDERFPMCSTFKWLAAAYVLHRVDLGQERLDRRISFGRDVLLANSPITSRRVGRAGMTLAELCHAAITVSDNAAANLILATFGGPEGLTRYARSLGDEVTRLDRREGELNESRPGDPRDTTSPRAMAGLLHGALVGDVLSPTSRALLARWLEASETNRRRLRANLPAGWRMGSKTGTGDRGIANDVGIFWPPSSPPIVVAVYLTESAAPESARNGAVAAVAARVTSAP